MSIIRGLDFGFDFDFEKPLIILYPSRTMKPISTTMASKIQVMTALP